MHETRDGRLTAADGTTLAYRDHGGSGRGLVLLHGGGANLVSMDQWAARLGSDRRTVALDIRACGQSGDPARFRLRDAGRDVAALAEHLDLGPVDVVGHSLGGFVGAWYGTDEPAARVVSIDGFGPGAVHVGSDVAREEFRAFQSAMRSAFFEMTAPPETGDRAWADAQVARMTATFPLMGYTAPNGRLMAERNVVDLGDGRYERRPKRHLFADAFADDGDADLLRMYREVQCPLLLVRCTRSGAPSVLDLALDELERQNEHITVVRLPLTHLAPAWDALEDVAGEVDRFFARRA